MKILAFLLLLDYSGSMDQQLQNRGKIEILKQETRALLSTAKPEAPSLALVFGTNPAMGCKDVEVIGAPTEKLSQKIQALRPGNQGKTPLSFGLRQMVRAAIRYDAQSSLVVTDGADSCGEDPCKALISGNAELSKANKKLKVHIIGFDLKNDNKKFECIKNLRLSNIEIGMSEALSGLDLINKLKAAQLGELADGEALKDADTARIKGLQKNAMKGKSGNSSKNSDGRDKTKQEKNEAFVEIVGAPSTSRFSATLDKGGARRNWLGSYVVTVVSGSYLIRFDDPNGAELKLELGAGTHTKIPWARLMKNSDAQLQLQSPTLSLKWTPAEATKAVHGEVAEFTSYAVEDRTQVRDQKVPFGEWNIEVVSPAWLKGKIKPSKIQVYAARSTSMDIESIYQDQIKWIDNPKPDKMQVLSIRIAGGNEDRYPIQPGLRRLPIPKNAEGIWLSPE